MSMSRPKSARTSPQRSMHASSNTPPSIGNSLFGVLQKYAKEHGHARVPVSHVEDGITLRRWVNKQRTRRHSLSEAKRRSLQQVPGWTWDSHGVTLCAPTLFCNATLNGKASRVFDKATSRTAVSGQRRGGAGQVDADAGRLADPQPAQAVRGSGRSVVDAD